MLGRSVGDGGDGGPRVCKGVQGCARVCKGAGVMKSDSGARSHR